MGVSTEKKVHPAYAAAKEERRWSGSLAELWATLKHDATRDRGHLHFAWRILPRGACVALEVDPETFRKKLRISRDRAPQDERGMKLWDGEVAIFLASFGLIKGHKWHREADPDAKGIAVVLTELYPGEVGPGKARCYVCGKTCKADPAFLPDGCACAGCTPSMKREHPAARQLP